MRGRPRQVWIKRKQPASGLREKRGQEERALERAEEALRKQRKSYGRVSAAPEKGNNEIARRYRRGRSSRGELKKVESSFFHAEENRKRKTLQRVELGAERSGRKKNTNHPNPRPRSERKKKKRGGEKRERTPHLRGGGEGEAMDMKKSTSPRRREKVRGGKGS